MKKDQDLFFDKIEGYADGILALSVVLFIIRIVAVCPQDSFLFGIEVTDCLTVILAALTISATIREYRYHRKRVMAEVLGQYNERYSSDEHINKVVNYIIHYMDGNVTYCLPSTHDAEMFMRFFEEMEIQINENRMEEHQVYSLFAYYAILLGGDEYLRSSLGISKSEYDQSKNWKHFKSFVNRMRAIQIKDGSDSGDKTSVDSINVYRSICQLYNEVISNTSYWNYYKKDEEQSIIKSFDQLYETGDLDGNNKNYFFVCNLLKAGSKDISVVLKRCLETLKNSEQNNDERELKGRVRHIVSLFFLGHVLCQNIPVIKIQIERQFKQFVANKMFKEGDSVQESFSFMWFILCIFHDFGYAYEKRLIPEKEEKRELRMPEDFWPAIYSTEAIERYAKFRQCVFGCNDHGIYGGKVFYEEMFEIGRIIADDINLKVCFETNGVEKIYQYAAWIIAVH